MYTDYVLEIYKVDLPILSILVNFLILTNTRLLFVPYIRT